MEKNSAWIVVRNVLLVVLALALLVLIAVGIRWFLVNTGRTVAVQQTSQQQRAVVMNFSSISPGVVAQGGTGESTVSGQAFGYCSLSWWAPGNSREFVSPFLAETPTTVSGWRGTLSCWPAPPNWSDMGANNPGHVRSTLEAAQEVGINFGGTVAPFTP